MANTRERPTADDLGFSMLRGHATARLTVAQVAFLLDVARREGFQFDTQHWTVQFPIRSVPYELYRHPNRAGVLQPALHVRTRLPAGFHSFEDVQKRYATLDAEWRQEQEQEREAREWLAEFHRIRESEGIEAAAAWMDRTGPALTATAPPASPLSTEG